MKSKGGLERVLCSLQYIHEQPCFGSLAPYSFYCFPTFQIEKYLINADELLHNHVSTKHGLARCVMLEVEPTIERIAHLTPYRSESLCSDT